MRVTQGCEAECDAGWAGASEDEDMSRHLRDVGMSGLLDELQLQ